MPPNNDKYDARTMTSESLHRLSAFTTRPDWGNPAGVCVGDALPDPEVMQQIAADVGFSETAFVMTLSEISRFWR
jgi:predicted PhzF superfamily epimerase YddE/YHI9